MSRLHTLVVCAVFVMGTSAAYAQCNPGNGQGGTGPDVIVGEIYGVSNYGDAGGFHAYSIGTRSCNIGTTTLSWVASTDQHPVIGQNLFRLKDGRFEQIGMSWLKHGFTALQFNACGCGCTPSGSGSALGVGCSDPYGSSLNGSNGSLGARSEVFEPHNGVYTYPRVLDPFNADLTWRRLRVDSNDVLLPQNAGAQYWVEAMYITNDDALAGNAYNNASHRPVQFSGSGDMSYTGPTVRQLTAIEGWAAFDPQVQLVSLTVPGENNTPGRLLVASRAYDNMDGSWNYEYVVYNQNSTRGVRSVTIPTPAALTISNHGFNDADYHSGEVFDGTDWTQTSGGTTVSWQTDTFGANANANAIRWGSAYSFRFTANAAPTTDLMTIGLFQPDTINEITASVQVPSGTFLPPVSGLTCTPDDNDVEMDWTNGAAYTSIEVYREGVLLATLPGTSTSYDDMGLATASTTTRSLGTTQLRAPAPPTARPKSFRCSR